MPSHDLEILHRASGPGKCAGDRAGADRRPFAYSRLPVAQYPNIVPPTVQVTTRYPGASAQTVLDTVALPIELQVNGVPGMIYMESTSAYDGTYNLTVSFEIGSDPNFDQVLVQNRVQNAMAQLPQATQAQGVSIRAKSPSILEFVTLNSPGRAVRRPLYVELRDDQPGQRAGASAGCRQCNGDGGGRVLDADLDGPAEIVFVRISAAGRDQRCSAAEPGGHGRAGRHAAGAKGPAVSVHYRHPCPGSTTRASSPTSSSRTRPPKAAVSSGLKTSRASRWARRPIPRISSSTASPPPASPSIRPPTPIR